MKPKKILLALVIFLLSLTLIGFAYRFSTRLFPKPEAQHDDAPSQPTTHQTSSPSPTPLSLKHLFAGKLSFAYPQSWLILFAPILDSKHTDLTTVYFVNNLTEYHIYAQCAKTSSCIQAPLTLIFSQPTDIWTGYSLADFIRVTKPDYPLDKLATIQFGELSGLGGYTDYTKLTYQALVPINQTSFQEVTLKATEDTRSMLTTMVELLTQVSTINPSTINDPTQLESPQVFTLKLSARLATTDNYIFRFILNNLLAQLDSTQPAHYFLYLQNSVSPDNYLDYTYYLLTDDPLLHAGDYSSAQITATLSPAPIEDMVPFLQDAKYCRQNTDCVYRTNFCTQDAYNRYHLFKSPWGCGAIDYPQLGSSADLIQQLDCDHGLDISYDGLECVNNQCVVHNPTPSCKE